ncbi:MAG TPA: hypothetical protein VEC36_09360 [Patescibacteria group bacterium]|nr:hypothetical protein [Patescibacteria group bacterium]
MKSLITAALFLMAFSVQAITNHAPDFKLEDQFSKEHSSKKFEGKSVIYTITDRTGAEYMENWIIALKPFKSRVDLVAVANVKGVPGLLKGFVRGKFRDVYSYPILMDWDAKLWEHFGCREGVPTVVHVDGSNVVRFKISGKGTEAEVKKLRDELNKLVAAQ